MKRPIFAVDGLAFRGEFGVGRPGSPVMRSAGVRRRFDPASGGGDNRTGEPQIERYAEMVFAVSVVGW